MENYLNTKDCTTLCTEIVEEFIQKNLINASKREEIISQLKSAVMKSDDWVILAETGAEESANA